jgi:DinB family protein
MVDLAPVGPNDDESPPSAPTSTARVLLDAFDRVAAAVEEAVDGLGVDELAARPAAGANSIAWLVWHLTRIQDDHLAGAFGHDQVWTTERWFERFKLPFDAGATGYGHSGEEVGAVRVDGSLLRQYFQAVHERTRRSLRTLRDRDLDRIVDESWDPPVTMAVRLVSVIADDLQHAGQAAYVRGLLDEGERGDD